MKGKICLITGANSGIGKSAAVQLAALGANVVMGCRDERRGREAVEDVRRASGSSAVELLRLDLSSFDSIRRAAEGFRERHPKLHVLLNNAGVWQGERQLTRDGFEQTFGVNHLGHFLLTRLLLDALSAAAPSRIVNVSSNLHYRGTMEWDDLQEERRFGGARAYAQSKLANVLFTRALAKRLPPGVTANAVHPGVIATNLFKSMPAFAKPVIGWVLSSPEKGARPLVRLASGPRARGRDRPLLRQARGARGVAGGARRRIGRAPMGAERALDRYSPFSSMRPFSTSDATFSLG